MSRLHRSGRLPLAAAAVLLPVLLPAAAAAGEGDPLRWPEVAALAAAQPAAREAGARAEGAAAAVSSAGALPSPSVTLSAGEAEARGGDGRRREWGVAVEVPLEGLAARGPRVAAAEAAAGAARAEAEQARVESLRALRRAFVVAAHGEARLAAHALLAGQAEALAEVVRRRAARGEARPTEVPRVEIEVERLRLAEGRARAAAEAGRLRLAAALGTPVGRVEAELERTLALPPLDLLAARLAREAPAVRAARERVAAAEGDLGAERRERLPRLSVGAARAEELDRRATTLSATVTVPLGALAGGRVRQAEAALAAERARLDGAEREARAAAGEAWHACAAGQEGARRYRDEVLPRADRAARATTRAFELGEAPLLEVLDARRALLDARREYLDLLLDMQHACGDLAALAGLELP